MRSQKIAAEENSVRGKIGQYGIWPVNPGRGDYLQALASQIDYIAVLQLLRSLFIHQAELNQQLQASGRAGNCGIGI